MASYLLKRILLAIPVLWGIATLIFLLSRLMPGIYGAELLGQSDSGYFGKADANSREKAYRQFLHRTGQDLPLFYFSLSPATEPDTLHLIFPESERLFLKRLSWQYGDWQLVSSFHNSLKYVEQATPVAQRNRLAPYLQTIYQNPTPKGIERAVTALSSLAPNQVAQKSQLQHHTAQLLEGQNPYAYLMPALRWHGTANQYHRWLVGLAQGEFGTSFRLKRPVSAVLFEAVGTTWWLLLISMVVATAIALELSLRMVRRGGHSWRKAVLPSLFLLDSIPLFVLAMLLLVLLASPAFLQLFPVYGMGYFQEAQLTKAQALGQWLQFMALPLLCLVLANLPYLTSQFYHALTDTANQDYIRTARAKGLSESTVIRKHMLRNALLPVITLLSDFLPALVAGAVIIETVFAIPGMGRLLIDSVLARDYPVIMGIVVLVAAFKLLSHLLADLLYATADPRIRHATT
ncbi:ABC transporter permease [Pontibacter roseus]|uniref:ABC transporter permease n=1 Tax=Pontibacter roseus TaxID=336989 RepID=UPI0003638CE1|nr:ABC transporter permease [Pontibacter roseus]